jgi:polyisoprenoid-binding protein YceI
MRALIIAPVLLLAQPALANDWTIVPAQSSIGFSGEHAGTKFVGSFRKWGGAIHFDPAKLAEARALIRIDLTSATTGNKMYDGTLPQSDWFDTAKTREGLFRTTSITASGTGYVAQGTLSLRGMIVPVTMPFTLSITGKTAVMQGKASVKRMAFGIGKNSDASGEWVSLDIPLTIKVTATRK